jgi:co-chaperonin GroES (HSP10)
MTKDKLFTPINGVIIEITKKETISGIELPENSKEKNEGVIVSEKTIVSAEMQKEFPNLKFLDENMKTGTRIKFTEGFDLGNNLFFVKLDKIIGIF